MKKKPTKKATKKPIKSKTVKKTTTRIVIEPPLWAQQLRAAFVALTHAVTKQAPTIQTLAISVDTLLAEIHDMRLEQQCPPLKQQAEEHIDENPGNQDTGEAT